jgi:ubiquinone/menaquinone biosynthesis C-methylase UbiE
MRGFTGAVTDLYQGTGARSVLEVGCGEGRLADHLIQAARPARFEACDVALRPAPDLDPQIALREASIYDLPYPDRQLRPRDLLRGPRAPQDPAAGLAELARVSAAMSCSAPPGSPYGGP